MGGHKSKTKHSRIRNENVANKLYMRENFQNVQPIPKLNIVNKEMRNLKVPDDTTLINKLDKINISDISEISDGIKETQNIFQPDFLITQSTNDPMDHYEIISKLGDGFYGVVWKVKNKINGNISAMKKIIKHKDTSIRDEMEILNEIEIMKKLDHPNIVKIFEYYNSKDAFYIVMEFCSGGELYYEIINKAPFEEANAAHIMYQIISVVFYCHSNWIIHRDIKPENILIENKGKDGLIRIKICDFGTAKIYEKNRIERQIVGSSYYIAPEVLNKNYNKECDLWSIGVIMYILLAGRPPFQGENDKEIMNNIKMGRYDLTKPPFNKISSEAKNLLVGFLQYNPEARITSAEALKHPWLKKFNSREIVNEILNEMTHEKILCKFIKNLISFKSKNILQITIIAYLVHNFPQLEEIENAFKAFDKFDIDGDGKINKYEFLAGLRSFTSFSLETLEQKVDLIFNNIDTNLNGYIEYEEFVCAAIDKSIFLKEEIIKFAFSHFDVNHTGKISFQDLQKIFVNENKIDNEVNEQLLQILKKNDLDHNGTIEYEEFKIMMIDILMNVNKNGEIFSPDDIKCK